MNNWKQIGLRSVIGLVAFCCLSACGGKSDSKISLSDQKTFFIEEVSAKGFQFSWTDSTDATSYQIFEDEDGISGFSPITPLLDASTNSYLHIAPLHLRGGARYILERCKGSDCDYSNTVYPSRHLLGAIGLIHSEVPAYHGLFGFDIALSGDGDTLAVSEQKTGSVFVYARSENTWKKAGTIFSRQTQYATAGFALSLNFDGTRMAVGVPNESTDASGINPPEENSDSPNSGATYIFEEIDDNWSQTAFIKASDSEQYKYFGIGVALSDAGDSLAVSSNDGVYVFQLLSDGWVDEEKLEETSGGPRVLLDQYGNRIVAFDSNGKLAVFDRFMGWTTVALLEAPTATEYPDLPPTFAFGRGLAMSADGSTVAVTEPRHPLGCAVHVFRETEGIWQLKTNLIGHSCEAYDHQHMSLSGTGDLLAIGARLNSGDGSGVNGTDASNNNVIGEGAVFIYSQTDGMLFEMAYIKPIISQENPAPGLGHSVEFSNDGNTLSASALGERVSGSNKAGAVYIY